MVDKEVDEEVDEEVDKKVDKKCTNPPRLHLQHLQCLIILLWLDQQTNQDLIIPFSDPIL